MKVIELIKQLNEIGFNENTELHFGSVVDMRLYRKFEIESIEDERFNSNENVISIDFDDGTIY